MSKNQSSGTTRSFQIDHTLFLVRQELPPPTGPLVPTNTHHLLVIDCSGSMSSDLPKLVEQVNNRLPSLVAPDDRVSLIWFSGRSQCGIILDFEQISGVRDLTRVQKAVRQWLTPVGMTGFVEPLELVQSLASRTTQRAWPISLFFMSDGCDNQWPRDRVLDAVTKASPNLAAATFVEYGFYADRALLTSMAARAGGTHVFAKDFKAYEPVFDAAMKRSGLSGKRRVERIQGEAIEGVVFTIDKDRQELATIEIKAGEVTLPEATREIWYLSATPIGEKAPYGANDPAGQQIVLLAPGAYAAIALFAARMKPLLIQPLLAVLGDVAFIKEYGACFGKQRYSLFMARAQRAVFDPHERLREGYNPALVPPADAFTILDLLDALLNDEATLLLDENFEYDAISRARESTEGAQALKLKYTKQPAGYPIQHLTWNEERANVSVLVRRPATIDLTARKRGLGALVANVPDTFETTVFRNYAVIKDGLVNIGTIEVRVSQTLFRALFARTGIIWPIYVGKDRVIPEGKVDVLLDLALIPILNRRMIATEIKARTLAEIERDLAVARAKQKVYNGLLKEHSVEDVTQDSPSLASKYGIEAATWLEQQGISDSGYQPPHTKQAQATDVYMTRELKVDVETSGWASLPTLAKVRERLVKPATTGKPKKAAPVKAAPNNATTIMERTLAETTLILGGMQGKAQQQQYLEGLKQAQTALTRSLIYRKARIVFATIVGQTWFEEFPTLEDNTIKVPHDGGELEISVNMREVPVEI